MGDDVRSILDRARRGDREAFGQLVRSHHRRVYMTAYRMMGNHDDASDVAQDAFIRAFRGLPEFDGRCDFFTWLYRIVINVSLNHLRQGKRRRSTPLEEAAVSGEASTDPRRALELRRVALEVHRALDALSPTLRATVVLVILEGMAYREAAEILECSEGTVAWRVHDARQRLRGHLERFVDGTPGR